MRIRFSSYKKHGMFMEDEEKDKEEGGELSDGALDEVLEEETDDDEDDLATSETGEDEYSERDWA